MTHITRRAFTTVSVGTAAAMLAGGSPARATGKERVAAQIRGMWIATAANVDWPSAPGHPADQQRAELIQLFDVAVARRLNAVYFQVRPSADAFWPSPYEPWSQYLTGKQGTSPGWDPLDFAVREAHRRRLQLHAWCNPYRISLTGALDELAPWHPARRHPEWVVAYGKQLFYNPGIPEVRRFVQDAMLDAVERYPVDGLHWDDYFYPYPVAGQTFDDDEAFARYGGHFPDRNAWRRNNVDLLVRETADRLRARWPQARFGISPFGVWRNAATDHRGSDTTAGVQTYDDLHADTLRWVREDWIDYICPQVYWNIGFAAADYAKLVPWWSKAVEGTRVRLYIGEALYKQGAAGQPAPWQDPAELSRHLTFDQAWPQVQGNIYFSAKVVAADPTGAMARVVADHYSTRARIPR
ncbi:glycoside hydrolase family 10 protein [Streptomyces sioyaensis]|uniref:glycoside hydrolase family 10 protein n=1 Tax=Streptomyces sioyaensis TaxID=67364 RepID=UPI0037D6357E